MQYESVFKITIKSINKEIYSIFDKASIICALKFSDIFNS